MPGLDPLTISRIGASYGKTHCACCCILWWQKITHVYWQFSDDSFCQTSLILIAFFFPAVVGIEANFRFHFRGTRRVWSSWLTENNHWSTFDKSTFLINSRLMEELGDRITLLDVPFTRIAGDFWTSTVNEQEVCRWIDSGGECYVQWKYICSYPGEDEEYECWEGAWTSHAYWRYTRF